MNTRGFTLMELLVVVMVISVLTAIAMPQYRRSLDRAKAAEAMQMLPALFEARERWMTEHGCKWTSLGYSCPGGDTLTMGKLDIESKGTYNGTSLQTDNFTYELLPAETGTNTNQQCVTARPRWGSNRGTGNIGYMGTVVIYYRGDKFSCTNGVFGAGCDILNIEGENGTCK